ncbi:MAG TPA: alpha/beta fold hydrolase [Thermoanaerobaculia bacterium]|nr:alpha/beta fold hydrolase [Thermoanaerobaculia bacterium]
MTEHTFTPAWFLRGPHAQTIWGRLVRPRRLVRFRRETITTPDGDELVLDHLDAPVRGERFRFVLMHGLEGSTNSVYMQGLLSVIARRGFGATAINFRSCARDQQHIGRSLPNRRPRLYHSGETGDFDFVVRTMRTREPEVSLLAVGASLGGNVLLKWLGEHPGQTDVAAAATFSVPYDLGAGSRHLEFGLLPRFYVNRFLATLKQKTKGLVARFPQMRERIDLDAVMRARTFREIDDAATAPIHGFRDADDYYARSSSIHFLGTITTPTLCLSAVDDPFLPAEALERARAGASAAVEFRITARGGHTGFVAGALPWRCEYWAEELVVGWLAGQAR